MTGQSRERTPLHPICLSLYPIVSAYTHNLSDPTVARFPVDAMLLPAACSLLMTGVVWTLARLYIRNLRRAALFASLWSVAFFTFGRVAAVVPVWLVSVVWLLALFLGAWTLSLSRADTRYTTGILNLMSAAMLALPLVTAVMQTGVFPGQDQPNPDRPVGTVEDFSATVRAMTPLPTFFDGH